MRPSFYLLMNLKSRNKSDSSIVFSFIFLLSMIFFYLCIAWNGYGLLTKHVSWYYSVSFSIFLIWKYSTVNDIFSLLFIFQSFIYFLPARVVAWWCSTLTQLSGGRWFESQEVLWISRKIRDSYLSILIKLQKTIPNTELWPALAHSYLKQLL